MRQQMPDVDVKLFDTPEMRKPDAGRHRARAGAAAAADRQHLTPATTGCSACSSATRSSPMRNPDGSVNKDILAAQGMNSEMFAQQLRQEFGMQQVLAGVTQHRAGVPPAGRGFVAGRLLQRREIQFERFDASNAYRPRSTPPMPTSRPTTRPTGAQFKAPEQASIEYVVLDLATGQRHHAAEEELRKYYNDNTALHRGRRAPCQPHPDQGRQGRTGGRTPEGQGARRGAAGRGAQEPRRLCRPGAQELAGHGLGRARRRPGLLRPRARWSSPSRTPCSR
jgi:hypothetical protein